jgi:predicted nucleic acid-binding protein
MIGTDPRSEAAGTRPRTFLDTNIWIYADDDDCPAKQTRAKQLIFDHRRAGSGVVSIQVLQEYFRNAVRKLHLDPGVARRKVELMTEFKVAVASAEDVFAAIDLYRLNGFSFWDSMIVHMARKSGCRVVLSEDMQHSREIFGIQIINPFA